jgi:hypothetical protein
MSTAFRATKGQPGVGADDGVDEKGAGLDLTSEPEPALGIASPHARSESVPSVIRELDRVRLVAARITAATGPKVSSVKTGISVVTSVRIVGA